MTYLDRAPKKFFILSLFLFSLIASGVASADTDTIRIQLTQINPDVFQIVYTLDRTARNLQLRSTPDKSRAGFWKPKSDEFELTHIAGNDVIRRTDGEPFQTAMILVDLVDISLPNYYRPFSPLYGGNNGLVIHTGHYFVCADDCANRPTRWEFQVNAENKNIVHYQGTSISTASWNDTDDGRIVLCRCFISS